VYIRHYKIERYPWGRGNMTIYFGFAIGDSMFEGDCFIERRSMTLDEVRATLQAGVISCVNPGHQATIDALRSRFGLDVEIPLEPPRVSLVPGDTVIVMGVRGLPRLVDRHEYTTEEISGASFAFHAYKVQLLTTEIEGRRES